MNGSMLMKPAEVGSELRLGRSEAYEFIRQYPEIAIALPGTRGVRVSRQRLADLIERLNPVAAEKR